MNDMEYGLFVTLSELSAEHFSDMTFDDERGTYAYFPNGTHGIYFSIDGIRVRISDDVEIGMFDENEKELVFNSECVGNLIVLMHELIHAHEFIISSSQIPEIRDVLVMTLYKKLMEKHTDLEEYLKKRVGGETFALIHDVGGTHSILFALKALDIDDRMGWKAGTTFGYSMFVNDSEE